MKSIGQRLRSIWVDQRETVIVLLENLYQCPVMSTNDVKKLIGTSYPAANQLVAKLVDRGILNELTGNVRNRKFRYDGYINLFDEPNN